MTVLQIDVTAVLLTGLRTQLPDARFVTETPGDLVQALPCARIGIAGGRDDGFALQQPVFAADCFADGTESSRQFALQIIGALHQLVGQIINGATISRVETWQPIPLKYENSAVRRQGLTFRVYAKTA